MNNTNRLNLLASAVACAIASESAMSLEEQLAAELAASRQSATERARPAIGISLWANTRRDPAKNHAHYTGRVTVSVQSLGEMLAQAIKDEKTEIELWLNVWQNKPGDVTAQGNKRPLLSGNATRMVQPQDGAEHGADTPTGAPAADPKHEVSAERPM